MGTSSNTPIGAAGATSAGLRSLHLVDIENLVGDPRADAAVVLHTFDLPVPANVHCAPGRDGAGTKLLDTVAPHTIATRYGRLVIGSGDGIFGTRARTALALGVDVSVVAREGGCSYRLWPFDPTLLAPAPLVLAA